MSQFIVSARKYRPARFTDVVGQEHVSQTLKNAIRQNTLAHAFLFCGPRGVGKTTCARILAKVLNCQNVGPDIEPCNKCDSCVSFDRNASLNIIELDAASNNSVDHMRSLNEQVRFQPQDGVYKVFIIDEVHMLSSAAFNAFLKTLEEPPSYAIFILATTEKHKIIPTILSRCQIFDFKRISVDLIVGQLKIVSQSQGIDADEEALHVIAAKADGALRDALSMFDRLASFGSNKITYQDVIQNLNILDHDYFFKIGDALIMGDIAGTLEIFDEILQKGFEGELFLSGLAEHFRNLLVSQHSSIHHLLEISDHLRSAYMRQAATIPTAFLLSVLDIANECDVNYRQAKNKRLHLEMALIRMNYLNQRLPEPTGQEKKTESGTSTAHKIQITTSPPEHPKVVHDHANPETDLDVKTGLTHEMGGTVWTQSDAGFSRESYVIPEPKPILMNDSKENSSLKLGSLTHFLKAVEKKYEENRDMDLRMITLDEVENYWKSYSEGQGSPTVRTVLNKATLGVHQNQITVTVGSAISKTVILQEMPLLDYLREKLSVPKLTLQIEIREDKATVVEKPKLLTVKEKLEYFQLQNPSMLSFMEKMTLKPDQE